MQTRHPPIADIRGAGLFVGIDLVADRETKKPIGDYAFEIVQMPYVNTEYLSLRSARAATS
jgi:4-aminobutyrate aminotransferase-like enzyme